MTIQEQPDSRQCVLLVDDHPLFREGVKAIINRSEEYYICCEAGTSAEALQVAESERPKLAIIDINLPDYDGIRLSEELLGLYPDIKILIVSMTTQVEQIAASFQAGATGYMNKISASGELIKALDATRAGNFYLDGTVSQEVAEDFFMHRKSMADGSYAALTPREREIMQLLARDYSVKDVAERLFISPRTVENHRSNLMRKLGLKSTIEFIRYAFKQGLIEL
ncbi:response regulator transcription factor [Maridesulfovibrio sp.]|uniref:response regulator transcription factor n=1 Tax=Maridesulfovibrio sp. TaxID=2795000 RepID=UPI0029CA3B1F|nr:response regulator transcription factor [Maridesulfovibrio sp.]